jgi:transposase
MTQAYSIDLRERVVSAVLNGESIRTVGKRFGVASSSVSKWSQLYRETGSLMPGKMGGHRPWLLAPHRDFVAERIKQTSHLTLSRLQQELAGRGVCVCRDTVWRFLRHEGLSFKKKPAGR